MKTNVYTVKVEKTYSDSERIDFLEFWLRNRAWLMISSQGRVTARKNPPGTIWECDWDGECVFDGMPDKAPRGDFRAELDEVISDAIKFGYYNIPKTEN